MAILNYTTKIPAARTIEQVGTMLGRHGAIEAGNYVEEAE